jgi:AmmeMemoRadiSam system protein B
VELRPRIFRTSFLVAAASTIGLLLSTLASAAERPRHPALSLDGVDIPAAIAKESSQGNRIVPLTGIGTPHHLLAVDLIARAFLTTRGNRYDRVVILSPDHFQKSPRPAATTRQGFETSFGPLESDTSAVEVLLEDQTTFTESDLFDNEHGVSALLPFVRLLIPETPVVAVALRTRSDRASWDQVAKVLRKIVTPRTLVIQSTDYSHYLLPHVARLHDQQTLNVLSAEDRDALTLLNQPAHLDSAAANYLQMALQREIFDAHPVVIGNRTGFDYIPINEPTTSYIVTAYSPDASALAGLRYADQQIYYFGGDVFIGRNFTGLLANEAIRKRTVASIQAVTNGAPLIVNLEGTIVAEVPYGLPALRHAMPAPLTLPILKELNVVGASLANNHSHDLGRSAFMATAKTLAKERIAPLEHLHAVDMGEFRLTAINYIGARDHRAYPAVRPKARRSTKDGIESLCAGEAKPPLIAFVHWGAEYTDMEGPTEREAARDLHRCGISAIIGAHSHRATKHPVLTGGGEQVMAYSIGNLIFDQRASTSSGALAELRVFKHGTFSLRLVPLPNLYEEALKMRVN